MKPENSPIVKTIVLSVLKQMGNEDLENKSFAKRINSDLIPNIYGNKVGQEIMKPVASPVQKPGMQVSMIHQPRPAQRPMFVPPVQGEFGKITMFLKDVAVTYIDCPGPDKDIFLIRAGRKMSGGFSLTKEEIGKILNVISEKASIPLVEGVFRAAVDNFIINAVVSDSIGSRFVIKKQTPYTLIKPGF